MSRSKNTLIACYTLRGKLVRTYPTAKEAAKAKKVYIRTIDKATRGDTKSVKGYMWRRVDAFNVPKQIEPLEKVKISSKHKRVAKLADNGEIIEIYPSLKNAAESNNIDPHTLRDIINKKYDYIGKTKFRLLSDDEII